LNANVVAGELRAETIISLASVASWVWFLTAALPVFLSKRVTDDIRKLVGTETVAARYVRGCNAKAITFNAKPYMLIPRILLHDKKTLEAQIAHEIAHLYQKDTRLYSFWMPFVIALVPYSIFLIFIDLNFQLPYDPHLLTIPIYPIREADFVQVIQQTSALSAVCLFALLVVSFHERELSADYVGNQITCGGVANWLHDTHRTSSKTKITHHWTARLVFFPMARLTHPSRQTRYRALTVQPTQRAELSAISLGIFSALSFWSGGSLNELYMRYYNLEPAELYSWVLAFDHNLVIAMNAMPAFFVLIFASWCARKAASENVNLFQWRVFSRFLIAALSFNFVFIIPSFESSFGILYFIQNFALVSVVLFVGKLFWSGWVLRQSWLDSVVIHFVVGAFGTLIFALCSLGASYALSVV
jgi:hypothetical protein